MATNSNPVEIVLNLLEYRVRLKTPNDYLRFWDELSVGLEGNTLVAGKTHILESQQNGKIGLTIISVPKDFSVVTKDTNFAIHSVLELPVVRYKCSVCSSYGPFRCAERDCRKRLCNKHAIILDGSMRAYCSEHAPKCKASGINATFWCDGPNCRGQVAWSDNYRVQHPNDPDHWYCPDCYKLQFPSCSTIGCNDTGTARCEYIDKASGNICNRSLCNRHVKRWQIYGPQKLGVALCPEHANIKQLTESEILYQMVAITNERRHNRRNRDWERIDLPSLMSIRHIYINSKNRIVSPSEIDRKLDILEHELRTSNDKYAQDEAWLIKQNKPKRVIELKTFGEEQLEGQSIFEKLQGKLRLQGYDDVASNLRFSDFKPRHKLLFVYLDSQFRGRFIGRQGSNIKQLQEYLDVRIQFEEK